MSHDFGTEVNTAKHTLKCQAKCSCCCTVVSNYKFKPIFNTCLIPPLQPSLWLICAVFTPPEQRLRFFLTKLTVSSSVASVNPAKYMINLCEHITSLNAHAMQPVAWCICKMCHISTCSTPSSRLGPFLVIPNPQVKFQIVAHKIPVCINQNRGHWA